MVPKSIDASFNWMRWVVVSMFRNTTIWPPATAGFGRNDVLPLSPTIVITTGAVPGLLDGPAGLPAFPPHAGRMAAASATTHPPTRRRMTDFSFGAVRRLLPKAVFASQVPRVSRPQSHEACVAVY